MNKIIFLDVDGPLIPRRAYYLPGQTGIVSVFDPVAVSLINKLQKDSDAKFVVSSTWRSKGLKEILDLFSKNGLNTDVFHTEWATPRKFSTVSRMYEIELWLEDHPEITHWVAFDDEPVDTTLIEGEISMRVVRTGNGVRTSFTEGFLYRHYILGSRILEVNEEDVKAYEDHEDWAYAFKEIVV